MISVSKAFRQEIENDNRNYNIRTNITLIDGTILNLDNTDIWMNGFGYEDAVSASENFQIGSAIINSFSITLNNIYDKFSSYDFHGAVVEPNIGMYIDEVLEEFPRGIYTVVDPQYNGATIKLTCYDNMFKFDKSYSYSNLQYPATIKSIVIEACDICGVDLNTYDFPHNDFIVNTRPSDETITFRNVISWCAQIAGCFARCNRYGELEIKWFNQKALETILDYDGGTFSPWNIGDTLDGGIFETWNTGDDADGGTFEDLNSFHSIKSIATANISTDDVVITGVRVIEKAEIDSQESLITYQSGADGYVIAIENNDLIQDGAGQTIAGWLGEQLIGFKFRKCTISHLNDPTIEAGDIAILSDRKGNSYEILISITRFTIGSMQTTESSAETPAKNSATRYSNATKNYVGFRKEIMKEKTDREKALEELEKKMDSSSGVYTTVETPENGGSIYYLHNKPQLSESDIVWKMTAESWGVSTDGGKTWNAGMTVDGDTIVRILTAEGVNASWINTGKLQVLDENKQVLFLVDMDTGKIIISGDSIQIGEKTVVQVLGELEKKTEQAITLNIILDNEYQGIPTDYQGNYVTFPEVQTFVTVLYGHTDVSQYCTFNIEKSDGISGLWDPTNRIYKVSSLLADEGWVDITATYATVFTVTKRFKIAKIKGGLPGTAGCTYFIELSADILKREQDGIVIPSTVTAYAYFRNGSSTLRMPYLGKWKIYTSEDGNTWGNILTSTENESNKNFDVENLDAAINFIKFELYAADETTTMLDAQTIPIVVDIAALTHEQIFNLLTNDGSIKGIYKEGNQLYISFTYAKGGELILGGKNNGNGILEVRGENDWPVVVLSNAGASIKNGDLEMSGMAEEGGKQYFYDCKIQQGRLTTKSPLLEAFIFMRQGANDICYKIAKIVGSSLYVGSIQDDDVDKIETVYIDAGAAINITARGNNPVVYLSRDINTGHVSCGSIYGVNANFTGTTTLYQLNTSGSKKRIVDTNNYETRSLYCYEMPAPMFGDIGEAELDECGECYVLIDDIFSETVNLECEYHVFLQKEGTGDLWVEEKDHMYFKVMGTPGLRFSWEIKVKQKDYEIERLDLADIDDPGYEIMDYEYQYKMDLKDNQIYYDPFVYEDMYMKEMELLIQQQEVMLYETT